MTTKSKAVADLSDDELAAEQDLLLDERNEITDLDNDVITDEQLDRIDEIDARLTEVVEAVEAREAEAGAEAAAADARAERIAAAKAARKPEVEDREGEVVEEIEIPEPEELKEPVLASARKTSAVRKAAARRQPQRIVDPEPVEKPRHRTTAAADARGFSAGSDVEDMDQLTKLFMERVKGFPKGRVGNALQKLSVANIERPSEEGFEAFAINDNMSNEQAWKAMFQASRESNLSGDSLVAAGGWCAPSQYLYDMVQWETATGALDLPTVTITRGGINFTKGPDFSNIYNNANGFFTQTEAQAVSGTFEKPFLEIDCPAWQDIRLDAIGWGVKAPILTGSAAGFPELIRRYLEGTAVAYYHKKNAYVINKVLGYLGTPQNYAELGSATGDLLSAVEVAVESLRYKFRLGENATVEAMFPMWVRAALRQDLSYRTGDTGALLNVTNAQVDQWFRARGISPQYVYDWAGQEISDTALKLPDVVRFGVWPAGTFTKGQSSVISLDAIYDSTELKKNMYTAAFFEEGILVANTAGSGRLFEVGLDKYGNTGAAIVGDRPGS